MSAKDNTTNGPALIRLRRKQKGWTQTDLATEIGVGLRQVMRYEKGESTPSDEVATAMARRLGGSPDEYRASPTVTAPTIGQEGRIKRLETRNRDLARRLEELEALVATYIDRTG
jgi:transcriptional regulator with XRE-family HTH domain